MPLQLREEAGRKNPGALGVGTRLNDLFAQALSPDANHLRGRFSGQLARTVRTRTARRQLRVWHRDPFRASIAVGTVPAVAPTLGLSLWGTGVGTSRARSRRGLFGKNLLRLLR